MTELESNLERILKARDADLGLFILAMHSLMERSLKIKYGIPLTSSTETSFGSLIGDYITDYKLSHGKPKYTGSNYYVFPTKEEEKIFNTLLLIPTNHYLANDVRHFFDKKLPEDAQVTIECFLAFAKAEKWGSLKVLNELRKELDNWDNHSPFQSAELTKAIAQIEKLKKENENLAEKANELSQLQNEYNLLSSQESVLKNQLSDTEARLSKKDAKLDDLRKKNNEQMMKFRREKEEILNKMKDYETTQTYLNYLEKVAFYSKTRHDYEVSVTKLTTEQNDILEQIKLDKDFLIKGAAGTGKSLVLLKALEKAVNNLRSELDFGSSNSCFRLLTYTKSLVKYNQYVTRILGAEVPEGSILTADSFLYSLLKKYFPNKRSNFDLKDSLESVFVCEGFTPQELYGEFQNFIWANCITKEEYIDKMCERVGMKTPMKKDDRVKVWNALEKVEKALEVKTLWPRNYAAKRLIEEMDKDLKNGRADFLTEYSFVDEAQDLPPVVLALIKKATKRAVFLAGDNDQSIFLKGFNWNRSGIDIRGRSRILKMNFRNTNQIHEFAEKYRSRFKHMDTELMPVAFRPGPPVELSTAANPETLMNQIVQQVKMLLEALNYDEENICILANTNSKLSKIQHLLDRQLGVKSVEISDENFDFEKTKGIRLCTMQNCKGMDFPVVLLMADHRILNAEENSSFDSETFYEQQYNLIYVCLTRAMEMLHIFTAENTKFEPFIALRKTAAGED